MKKKLAIVIGTRPEAIKLIPLYLELAHSAQFTPVIVSTGQHIEMVRQIFDFFGITPEIELNVMTRNQSLSKLTSILTEELGKTLSADDFKAIIVQGDTTSAFIASLIGFYNKTKVVHVEAGLRTRNKFSPFPEEMNRKLISSLADVHFCPTEKSAEALRGEGFAENILNVGNTVIDSLLLTKRKTDENQDFYEEHFGALFDTTSKIVLITGHRRENFGAGMKNICQAILEIARRRPDYELVYPVHLNPNIQQPVRDLLGNTRNIHLLEPLPYDYMVFLMNKSHIILTDSGGIQEEAPSLGKPILVLRDTTERPEGIEAGCARLVGTSPHAIVSAFNELADDQILYAKMATAANPYGDGQAVGRIIGHLERLFKA